MILQVYVGKNLNYTVGSVHYLSDTSDPTSDTSATTSDTTETTTTIILCFAAIATVMVLITILLVIAIICIVRKKTKKKSTTAFTDNTGVNMYASPAYGTHQTFTEPGMDHLYEPVDKVHGKNVTTLQDTAPGTDNDEIDAESYLKMKPSCEVVDQAITKGSVVTDGCSTIIGSKSTDEYVQPLDNNLPACSIKDDDGNNDGVEDNKGDNKNDDVKDDDKDSHDKVDHDKDNEVNEDDKDDDDNEVNEDDKDDGGEDDHGNKDDDKGNDKDDDDGYDNNDQKSMNTEK